MNSCKYDSYHNIPARVFFEIRETGNFQLLCPKPKTDTTWLGKLYVQIYDDYFIKLDNADAKRYTYLLEAEATLENLIKSYTLLLELHWNTPPEIWNTDVIKQGRERHIAKMNEQLDIAIDPDGDFDEQVQIALNQSLGFKKNDLNEIKMELEQLRDRAGNTVFEFYDDLQQINEANGQAYGADVLLPVYVSARKSAEKKAEKQRMQQLTHNR